MPRTLTHRTNPMNTTPRERLDTIGRRFLKEKGFTISENANNNILDLIKSHAELNEKFDEFIKHFNGKGNGKTLKAVSVFLIFP